MDFGKIPFVSPENTVVGFGQQHANTLWNLLLWMRSKQPETRVARAGLGFNKPVNSPTARGGVAKWVRARTQEQAVWFESSLCPSHLASGKALSLSVPQFCPL